jgi:hypothetical protein
VASSAVGGGGGVGAQTFGDERSMVMRAHHEAIINRRHGGGGGGGGRGGGGGSGGGGAINTAHTFSYALQHVPSTGGGGGGRGSPHAPVSPTHTVLAGGGRGSLASGRTSPSLSDMPAGSDVDPGHHHRLGFGSGGGGGGGGGGSALGGGGHRDPERDPELSHTYTYHTLISHTRGGVDAEEERERLLERERAEEERERKLREMVLAHRAGVAANGRLGGSGSGAPESPLTVVRRLAGSPGAHGNDSLYDRSQVINVSAYGYAHHATRHTHRPGGGHSVLHSYAASARHHRGGGGGGVGGADSPDPLGEHDHEHDAEHEHEHEHDEAFADLSHAHIHEPEASMSGFGSGSVTQIHASHPHRLHASESTTHTAAASPVPARKVSVLKKESVTAPVSFGLTR